LKICIIILHIHTWLQRIHQVRRSCDCFLSTFIAFAMYASAITWQWLQIFITFKVKFKRRRPSQPYSDDVSYPPPKLLH